MHLTAPDKPRRFTIIPKVDVGLCPHCNRSCRDIQRYNEYLVQDIPLDRAVELIVRSYDYWCKDCNREFTPSIPFLAHTTKRLVEHYRIIRWLYIDAKYVEELSPYMMLLGGIDANIKIVTERW